MTAFSLLCLGKSTGRFFGRGRRTSKSLRRWRPYVELLEGRTLPSATMVATFGANAQHTSLYTGPSQNLNQIIWKTPVDLQPNYSGSDLFIHYGAPLVTAGNTVIVPVKTGLTDGFEVNAFNGDTGGAASAGAAGVPKYTLATDYTLNGMFFDWTPSYSPVLASDGAGGTRLYFPGAGGTIWYVNNPDATHTNADRVHIAFYGLSNYLANTSGFNSSVFIDTPITADSKGDIYFGFRVQGTAPLADPVAHTTTTMQSGYARIDPSGKGTYVLAGNAAGDANVVQDSHNVAPALSSDEKTLYVAVKGNDNFAPYLLALDSTTLATNAKVALKDPRNQTGAAMVDDSTASPMVAPDGTVFFGVLLYSPYNGSRGAMLHFSANLQKEFAPSAFGWDNTNAIVPASMVPSYHGTSSFLIFSKYNNYANAGGDNGDGVNKIAILDPYSTEVDPHASSGGLPIMREVLTVAGPTPDPANISPSAPLAVREWCINTAAVDQANDSVITPSEDGNIYRWNLATGSLSQTINVGTGIGEAYVPTIINPHNGQVLTINNATLFAIGQVSGVGIAITSSLPSNDTVVAGQTVTFTATIRDESHIGFTPTGTVTFTDALTNGTTPPPATTLTTTTLNGGQATFSTSSLAAGSHFIAIHYNGDIYFRAGSAALVETIHHFATKTSVTSSPNPSDVGSVVTFTAAVTSTGSGAPTGMVRFMEGTSVLWQEAVDSTGHATFSTAGLSLGKHTLTAAYHSDPVFAASQGSDANAPQIVQQISTTLNLSSSPRPSFFGQLVIFTAVVSAKSPGSGTPDGTVTFKEGSKVLGTASLRLVGGVDRALFGLDTLSVGTHTATAVYAGDVNFLTSTGNDSASPQVVKADPTTTALKANAKTSVLHQTVTFTAIVRATPPGIGSPTGTVTFKDSGATLGTATLSNGQATFTTAALAVGNHAITASYGGDNDFTASTSPAYGETVHSSAALGTSSLITTNAPTSTASSPADSVTASDSRALPAAHLDDFSALAPKTYATHSQSQLRPQRATPPDWLSDAL
jgi:Bacterial Ig-like domain (group 3)